MRSTRRTKAPILALLLSASILFAGFSQALTVASHFKKVGPLQATLVNNLSVNLTLGGGWLSLGKESLNSCLASFRAMLELLRDGAPHGNEIALGCVSTEVNYEAITLTWAPTLADQATISLYSMTGTGEGSRRIGSQHSGQINLKQLEDLVNYLEFALLTIEKTHKEIEQHQNTRKP